MVERAFRDGDSDHFLQYVEKYNSEIWSNRFVFDTIAQSTVQRTRDRPDAHYELVRDLLQFSIEQRTVDWDDDDVLQEWIHLLVEQKYPWYVCSVWNHLRPTAISFLHQCSMSCFHTGNLHMLIHQGLIAHLWDDADFLSSMVDQSVFFHIAESSNKSFRKTVRKQVDFFPFDDLSVLQSLVDALLLWKSHRMMRLFLNHPQREQLFVAVPDLIQKVCYNHDVALYDDVRELYYKQGTAFTIQDWYEMFANVHRPHTSCNTPKSEALTGVAMFGHLLQKFDECHRPEQWLELLTSMPDSIPFLTLFVHNPHAHELLDIVLQKTNTALDALPEEHTTHILSSSTDLQWSLYSRDKLFHTIDSVCENTKGWTTFANALRWGNWQTVKWMLNHGDNKEMLEKLVCKLNVRTVGTIGTSYRNDNALTLSLYNPDEDIYEHIFQYANEANYSEEWILQDDGVSIITALSRLFFFHPQLASDRFDRLLSACDALASKKNTMIIAFANEWHDHYLVHQKKEHTRAEFASFVDNPLMQRLLQLPCEYTKYSVTTLLTHCDDDEQFDAILENIHTTSTTLIKDVYLCMGMNHDASLEQLLKIEKLDVFRKLMANTQTDVHHFYLMWSAFPEEVFIDFVHRMRNEWYQPSRRVMPADYTFYSGTHMQTSPRSGSVHLMWRTWLVAGLLPPYMYSKNHTTPVPVALQKMLQAHRLLRRYLRRQYRTRYANKPLHHQRKKLRFMVKCRALTK